MGHDADRDPQGDARRNVKESTGTRTAPDKISNKNSTDKAPDGPALVRLRWS